jgi:hypothetical protein
MKMPIFLTHFCDIMRRLGFAVLVLTLLSSCGGIIYAIRGPKYDGKFEPGSYPETLDSTSYYERTYADGDGEPAYGYVKFNGNGIFYGYASYGKRLTRAELDTLTPNPKYFKVKNGYLRWEVFHDYYNGYNLYKAEIKADSIVTWQIPYKRITRTYYKMSD